MTQPFVGQIQAFSFNFAPKNWLQCDGQLLSVAQNQALFSLLGTYYGGNGSTTFGLPDLRGRVPVHEGAFNGSSYPLGTQAGTSTVQLLIGQMPMHNHLLLGVNGAAATGAGGRNPSAGAALANGTLSGGTPDNFYGPLTTSQPLNAASMGMYGSSQAHDNMQPYLAVNWCICQFGIYPSRN